jgi:hypothetical protein
MKKLKAYYLKDVKKGMRISFKEYKDIPPFTMDKDAMEYIEQMGLQSMLYEICYLHPVKANYHPEWF